VRRAFNTMRFREMNALYLTSMRMVFSGEATRTRWIHRDFCGGVARGSTCTSEVQVDSDAGRGNKRAKNGGPDLN
jgi:hypothetical protein